MNTKQLKAALRNGPYAWPGGYPMYFIAHDGEAISFEAVKDNYWLVLDSMRKNYYDVWRIVGVDINWEDPELYCAHTGKRIPSAYGEES